MKRPKYHPDRIAAQKEYEAKLALARIAECGIDEVAAQMADDALDIARTHLIQMEAKHPTYAERKRDNYQRYLDNRGLGGGLFCSRY